MTELKAPLPRTKTSGGIVAASKRLPANVRALAGASLANDFASRLAYPVVPLFLTVTLGAPVAVVGLIEGIADGIATGMKGFPGWISDRRRGRRKPWLVGGYGVTAVARVMLAAAPAWGWVLAARTLDRFGQSLRGAPRDALISDSTPAAQRGAAFGFYRSVDTLGSILGALGAFALLAADAGLRTILWVAAVPGLASFVLLRRVRDIEGPLVGGSTVLGPTSSRLRALPRSFWVFVGTWFLFSLGNSSDVFLILRAHSLGLSLALAVLAYLVYNVVQSGLAWPLGSLSDRIERSYVISAGLAVFALVYLGFAYAPGGWAVWPLFAIYGGYIAATEGVARAWVADHAPAGAAGTAYGVLAVTTGVGILAASSIAGILWTYVSVRAPFVFGAATAGAASLIFLALSRGRSQIAPQS